jgi:uridine phosphorylase
MLNARIKAQNPIGASELVVNPDGSVYHLKVRAEHLSDTIILVGDQYRVERISQHFDSVEFKIANREFVTHTGIYKGKRLTVMSSGIGADNIDIVINELDAAVNIDLNTRLPKEEFRQLNIVRLGTSGSLQEDIPVDSYCLSSFGLGLDGVLSFYAYQNTANEKRYLTALKEQMDWPQSINQPYLAEGSNELIEKLRQEAFIGITATANGFYGPQGRQLALRPAISDFNQRLQSFELDGQRITNYEMETSALYGLGSLLGHNCATICAIIANRYRQEYSKDYKKTVDELILYTLDHLTA